MADPRHGEGFPRHFDDTNRRSPFIEDQPGLPEAGRIAFQAREALKLSLEEDGWPERPETETLEDFFNAAKTAVTERWRSKMTDLMAYMSERWLATIPYTKETQSLRMLLSNPEVLDQKMAMQQMGAFEDLKNYSSEAWCTLMLMSSERQLAAVATTREWIHGMDEADFEKFGLQKSEMKVFIELAAIFGKYIDSAYVRQIELAATPGGNKTSPLAAIEKAKAARKELSSEQGIDRIYDLQRSSQSDEIDVKTYSEVFPNEWPKIITRFRVIAEKIRKQCTENKLPETYLRFADYLDKMASTYGSASISPQELYAQWQDLMKDSQELAESGFPLMLVPQGCATVAGDANKVDVEIRFGMRTKETRGPEKLLNLMTQSAQAMLDRVTPALEKPKTIPPVILNIQPFAFGPNLYWMTRGESGEQYIMSHTGAVREVAQRSEVPCLKKVFSDNIDEEKYVSASIVATSLHEIGHWLPTKPAEDKKVEERVGIGPHQDMLEEHKAWCSGVKAFAEIDQDAPEAQTVDKKTLIQAVIGAHLDYLKNKSSEPGSSGERYYLCGIAVLDCLLEKNIIQKNGSQFTLVSVEGAIQALSEISDDITTLYTAEGATPADSIAYVEMIKKKKENPQIQEILRLLQAA